LDQQKVLITTHDIHDLGAKLVKEIISKPEDEFTCKKFQVMLNEKAIKLI